MSSLVADLGAWNWLILAALLLALELMVPGVFLIWLGAAAAIVGLVALTFSIGWQLQLVLFGVLSIVLVLLVRRFYRRARVESDRPLLNRRALQHVGKAYVLQDPIIDGTGKVRIGDTVWSVRGPDLPKGVRVTVTRADGAVLFVERAAET